MTREEQIMEYANSFKGKGVESDELKEIIRLAIIDGAKWADAHPKEYSIPSGLDEAAKQFQKRWDNDQSPEASFKAGAQWRDAQIPKLPDSIDEAAEKVEDYYDVGEEHGYLYCHRGDIKDAFKAGAKWMAQH